MLYPLQFFQDLAQQDRIMGEKSTFVYKTELTEMFRYRIAD